MFNTSTALAINIVGIVVCAFAAYLNFQSGRDSIGMIMVGFTAMNSALAAINWTRL